MKSVIDIMNLVADRLGMVAMESEGKAIISFDGLSSYYNINELNRLTMAVGAKESEERNARIVEIVMNDLMRKIIKHETNRK